ncbi:MAG: tetratricopeptide repeat protein [Paludibacteraceae bacterium]|nr:tetratricopeptide repeat protein [Paludibacteraceae bacterium]
MVASCGVVCAQLNTDRLMSVGRSALYFQDYVLSIQYFNKVIQVKPNLAEPYFFRAVAKIYLEDYDGAKRDLDSVIRRNPFMPMAYYSRGFVACRMEKWEEAERDMQMALEYSPENVTYRINLVNIYEATERLDSAMAVLELMVRQSPKWTELKLEKMRLQVEMGDTIGAKEVANTLVAEEPHNEMAYSARAFVYLMLEEEDSALIDCDKAVKLGTSNPNVYINRGIINYKRNKFREAMADYGKAIELDGSNVNALFNRALLRCELGDHNNALSDLDKLITIEPDLDEAIYQRGVVNAFLGNTKEAITDFSTIIERHPTFVPAYYARAEQYEKQRKPKEAYLDKEAAYRLMEDHKNGRKPKKKDQLQTKAKVASEESIVESVASMFVSSKEESETESGVRGLVQNQRIDLSNEDNFIISYYHSDQNSLINKEYNPLELQDFVKKYLKGKDLYMVTKETPLTSSITNYYFSEIEGLSRSIVSQPYNGVLYLLRGLDYAALQDFGNALDDFTRAIVYGVDDGIAYFMRACIRYKQYEALTEQIANEHKLSGKALSKEWELVLRDMEQAIDLMPKAGFTWYNKGNMLTMKKEYHKAIQCYNKAVELEPGLGEAYFNRGLTYMLSGDIERAKEDMSKAGELGIYRSYRIIKELKKQEAMAASKKK